jgi:hypothetical protein
MLWIKELSVSVYPWFSSGDGFTLPISCLRCEPTNLALSEYFKIRITKYNMLVHDHHLTPL